MQNAAVFIVPILAAMLSNAPGEPAIYSGRERQLDVTLPRIDASIVVDGRLDEPAWNDAVRLEGFSQYSPTDGVAAEQGTVVLAWYSPTAIYFGVRASAAPDTIRATLANRDHLDTEDQIQIFLSTFDDGRQAFMFAVNPLGVQADGALTEGMAGAQHGFEGLASGREAVDLSPDFVFDSKGRLTANGYEIEVRIPFKSLRYQAAPRQDWGIHIIRQIQSNGHEDSWAPARRNAASFLAQAGHLRGLADLRRGIVLDLNPAVTSHVDGARQPGGWRYGAGAPEVGGNVRWGMTSNLTLNGTINPDFSQIESDVTEFVYDPRQAVYYPEKRPFFLDAIEQFTSPNNLIYTRRIVAPLGAAKVTGKASGADVALLAAVDDTPTSATGSYPVFTIARLQRAFGPATKGALVYTDRIDGPDDNRVIASDWRFTFKDLYRVQVQGAVARTVHSGTAVTAPLWYGFLSRDGRRFGFQYQVSAIDRDFRTDSGFIARPGIADVSFDNRVTFYGSKASPLETFTADVAVSGTWQYEDFVAGRAAQDRKLHFNNNAVLRGGWKAGGSVLIESFGYDQRYYSTYALEQTNEDGSVTRRPFVGVPHIPNLDYVLQLTTPQFSTLSASAFWLWGHDENFFEWAAADILFLKFAADWRPTAQLRINPQYQVQQYRRRTDDSIVGRRRIPRLKVEYQLTRSVFLRWVGEYDANEQDDLRDASRTELPILILDPASGLYSRATGFTRNSFRNDWLFSYQPTPGTVIFAGYGSTTREPNALKFSGFSRVADGFFLKVSYLFRL